MKILFGLSLTVISRDTLVFDLAKARARSVAGRACPTASRSTMSSSAV
ncbi:MAG: hypothetical protein WCC00_15000 [Candidatus Aminicenantales bacterium]